MRNTHSFCKSLAYFIIKVLKKIKKIIQIQVLPLKISDIRRTVPPQVLPPINRATHLPVARKTTLSTNSVGENGEEIFRHMSVVIFSLGFTCNISC